MALSVRMNPLLERELEQAARRQGVSKSQFIIEAVERALGRKDPAQLYRDVMAQAAEYEISESAEDANLPLSTGALVRQKLQAQHQAHSRDWLAYQEARKKGLVWTPDDGEMSQ